MDLLSEMQKEKESKIIKNKPKVIQNKKETIVIKHEKITNDLIKSLLIKKYISLEPHLQNKIINIIKKDGRIE